MKQPCVLSFHAPDTREKGEGAVGIAASTLAALP